MSYRYLNGGETPADSQVKINNWKFNRVFSGKRCRLYQTINQFVWWN
jgi:hypothetical protein